ncbi:MAG: hypothetical protein OXC92_09000 [Flavobacteriaceae bacterium]|nr:hypothetical protein [Flavobacteriaceae bacterium]
MKKLNVHLENCYGIGKMNAEFDFSKKSAYVIYASNGTMKSSFAKTFKDHSKDLNPQDEIYQDRIPFKNITYDNKPIESNSVFVIESYDQFFMSKTGISTLLVNDELRSEYGRILISVEEKVSELLSLLNQTSGLKQVDLKKIISNTFTKKDNKLFRAFECIQNQIIDNSIDVSLAEFKFESLFNEKINKLLESEEVQDKLKDYTIEYERLQDECSFLKKGEFNHYQVNEIAKQLENHHFFRAGHKIIFNLKDAENKVFETENELKDFINKEISAIFGDKKLKLIFEKIDKLLKNKELREFRDILRDNQDLLLKIKHRETLKRNLLVSYIMKHRNCFEDLMKAYNDKKMRIDEITQIALGQKTKWQESVDVFNQRFSVPFKISVENSTNVILEGVTPNLRFEYEDYTGTKKLVERSNLLNILSHGEKRALYLLNIIFEVLAKKQEGKPVLFIVDDIADSFDYKNKYAIVEYLNDIFETKGFHQIILTHNYDFYRTIRSRLRLFETSFIVTKSKGNVFLKKDEIYHTPFNKWKNSLLSGTNDEKIFSLIALIPFVRNLADYCGKNETSEKLAKVLHYNSELYNIKVKDLLCDYSKVLNLKCLTIDNLREEWVIDLIYNAADKMVNRPQSPLELNKNIILSIAIRLKTEEYIIDKIGKDHIDLKSINRNQTGILIKRFNDFINENNMDNQNLNLINRVKIMTPENIHINSFMYEPLMDLSLENLCNLYKGIDCLE